MSHCNSCRKASRTENLLFGEIGNGLHSTGRHHQDILCNFDIHKSHDVQALASKVSIDQMKQSVTYDDQLSISGSELAIKCDMPMRCFKIETEMDWKPCWNHYVLLWTQYILPITLGCVQNPGILVLDKPICGGIWMSLLLLKLDLCLL